MAASRGAFALDQHGKCLVHRDGSRCEGCGRRPVRGLGTLQGVHVIKMAGPDSGQQPALILGELGVLLAGADSSGQVG